MDQDYHLQSIMYVRTPITLTMMELWSIVVNMLIEYNNIFDTF